tara:strand:- start:1870 stop:2370 length:501 start_codon:yes stop_codon:yes gene_type:complete
MTKESVHYDTTAGQEELRKRGLQPLPKPDELTAPYWQAARQHQLKIQCCDACGEFQHPPKAECERCGSANLEWQEISGKAEVYSFVIDRRLMIPSFEEPYVVAQINPVEARRNTVRITANICDCELEDVYIGMPVEVFFEDRSEDISLPQFRPGPGAKLKSRGETP